jgi:hypothetical protein
MPSSISTLRWLAWPSSSTLSEPRRSAMVPSSSTVTPLAATRWPMRPLKALEPLRLKSPSSPWPMASCSSTPGQPGPSTTVISPAGAGRASRLVSAALTASFTYSAIWSSVKYARPKRPPPPPEPISRRPFCSAITVTDRRTSGRTSAASVPSARATITTSYSLASPAITCTTRGSLARASFSTRPSSSTLAVLSSDAIGSWPPYSERLPATLRAGVFTRRFCPDAAIERTVRAASISEASEISSE